nr:hypothetical protein [uncultured Acetatifactor sp.]
MIPKMQFVSPKRRNMRRPLRYFFANREVKDRLFCYIFERDPKALLQLYNALSSEYDLSQSSIAFSSLYGGRI